VTATDYAVLALYAGLVLGLGLATARGHQRPSDFALGSRAMPTWAVLLSMVATELSAATFIGVPQAAFAGDWSYLQLAFGALLGKLVVALWVVPRYYRLRVVTVYGFLERRFGPRSRRSGALVFVAGRVLASGVRLFVASLAFATVAGVDLDTAIVVTGLAAGTYTLVGGIRAVIWTDVLQAGVFVLGAGALLYTLASLVPGGLANVFEWASEAGRSRVFHTSPWFAWQDGRAFGMALIGGFFLTLATHTTDHDMVQRLLTTRDSASAGRALVGSALLNFPMTLLFLGIGTGLAFHYLQGGGPEDGRQVLPWFALNELPAGLRGLVFAGLFAAAMSSLDSAVCAITTTIVSDLESVFGRAGDDRSLVVRTRWVSAGVCLALIATAIGMGHYERALAAAGDGFHLVELALSAMTILYGGLLGVFGVGLLSRSRGTEASLGLGLSLGCAAGLALFLHPILLGRVVIAWTLWIPISASVAFLVTAARAPEPDTLGREAPASSEP